MGEDPSPTLLPALARRPGQFCLVTTRGQQGLGEVAAVPPAQSAPPLPSRCRGLWGTEGGHREGRRRPAGRIQACEPESTSLTCFLKSIPNKISQSRPVAASASRHQNFPRGHCQVPCAHTPCPAIRGPTSIGERNVLPFPWDKPAFGFQGLFILTHCCLGWRRVKRRVP